jgi:DMSO/TMAO reductase YedYZ molybdopterin-dependent catalytic subunit
MQGCCSSDPNYYEYSNLTEDLKQVTYYFLYHCVPGIVLVVIPGNDWQDILEDPIGKNIGSIYDA